jgi:pilus assembly protein Flp/PilA
MLNDAGRVLVVALRELLGGAARALSRGHRGQSMVEYGIVVALIAIVAFAAVQLLGTQIDAVFRNILDKLQGLPAT